MNLISIFSPLNNEFATSSKLVKKQIKKKKIQTRDITIKLYKEVENF